MDNPRSDNPRAEPAEAPPVTPALPAEVRAPQAAAPAGGTRPPVARVHIPADIARRLTEPEADSAHDLDALVHNVLIIGLALSTILMLAGVGLDLVLGRALPETVAGLGEIIPRIAALRPSGLLTLGLLILIAMPILRVIGSIGAFVYERDWRYAGITATVLLVMAISMILGKG